MALLSRGEPVTLIRDEGAWLYIAVRNAMQGYVQAPFVISAKAAIKLATVLAPTKLFGRPDLLALCATRRLQPASLVMVLLEVDLFSYVNMGGQRCAWVLTDVLVDDPAEVEVARLLAAAKLFGGRQTPQSRAATRACKEQFGSTRLMQILFAPTAPAGHQAAQSVYRDQAAPAP